MVELSPREREILTFEREWWKHADAKDAAARVRLGLTPEEYYRTLTAIIDRPGALAHDPLLVRRLRRQRLVRQRQRQAGRQGRLSDPARGPHAGHAASGLGRTDGSGSPFGAFSPDKAFGPFPSRIPSSNVPLVEPLVTRDSSGSTHFPDLRLSFPHPFAPSSAVFSTA